MTHSQFLESMQKVGTEVTYVMASYLPFAEGIERPLLEAMGYSSLVGGKRIRPFLVWATAGLFQVPHKVSYEVAAALEFVHSYSLVHDDLPCMDNADLRRGQPSCHKQFNEETALLAGDALYGLAFEILASLETINPSKRCLLIQNLAKASGARGMIAGQMMDLLGRERTYSVQELIHLHNLKTGELIQFACEAGAILGNASSEQSKALKQYGQKIGLLYQVTDDLLDACGDPELLGKETHQDTHKNTFVTLMGIEKSKEYGVKLAKEAKDSLSLFKDSQIKILEEMVDYIEGRLF